MLELKNIPTVTQLREQRGLTRQQLAAKADVSPSTLLKIERGQVVARKSLESVCKALGVKPCQVGDVQVRQDYGRRVEPQVSTPG